MDDTDVTHALGSIEAHLKDQDVAVTRLHAAFDAMRQAWADLCTEKHRTVEKRLTDLEAAPLRSRILGLLVVVIVALAAGASPQAIAALAKIVYPAVP